MVTAHKIRFARSDREIARLAAFMLHAALIAWMLHAVSEVPLPPQLSIEVSLVMEPAPETAQKSEESPPPAPQARPQAFSAPVKKSRPLATAPARAERLAALTPSSGESVSPPKQIVQAAYMQPDFDASYLRNPPPVYPTAAKRRGIQGTVTLDVTVTPDGLPQTVQVAQPSGFTLLDEAAKEAVRRWKFVPARRGDEIVEARVLVPIEFRLQ